MIVLHALVRPHLHHVLQFNMHISQVVATCRPPLGDYRDVTFPSRACRFAGPIVDVVGGSICSDPGLRVVSGRAPVSLL